MFERVGCVLKDGGLGRQTIIWTRKPTCFEPPLSVPFRSEILVVYFLLMKIIDRIKVFEVEYFLYKLYNTLCIIADLFLLISNLFFFFRA